MVHSVRGLNVCAECTTKDLGCHKALTQEQIPLQIAAAEKRRAPEELIKMKRALEKAAPSHNSRRKVCKTCYYASTTKVTCSP